jgi:asparagine synthase (glutamine-hydrolysing)
MCSFLFSTKSKENVEDLNFYLKFRGPDETIKTNINNSLFLHNLLSITGDFKPQPFVEGDIVAVYNGEIYNYKSFGDYHSDGECLIPLYKKNGSSFIKKLDGEFAICIVDYEKRQIIVSSDIFKTKPLFIGLDDNIGASSYKTPLEKLGYSNIIKAEPNTIYTICMESKQIINKETIYKFDLVQHKRNYKDWTAAFERAIKKRIEGTDKNVFIGLSSGYDSGLIYNELLKTNKKFYTYSLIGTENEEIIDQRLALKTENCESYKFVKNDGDRILSQMTIKKNTEPFEYTIPNEKKMLIDDQGSYNFATICRKAKRKNCKICLSGSGADEIISDYGFNGEKFFPHSNFGGLFPDDLSSIFPWSSFYGSTLESYIAKEEYVGGSFGIEMRYPFLDKDVVQEYLWLHQDIKNKAYKAPIAHYFDEIGFPYEKSIKRGF